VKFTIHVPGMTLYPGTGRHWWEHISSAQMAMLARRAEDLGFDYITVSDHIVMDGESAVEMGSRWVHSLSAAGFLLGATSRITVVPLVVAPYRNPIELAKAIATLDYVSGGRAIPNLLVGYKRWEFELMGAPYARRGQVMDEWVQAMVELWSSERPMFHGEFVSFDDVVFDPKPVQRPLPLWFGGRTPAALARIGRHGDGWVSYSTPRSQFAAHADFIRDQPGFRERPRPLELWLELFEGRRHPDTHAVIEQARIVREPEAVLEQVHEIAAVGATMTSLDDLLGTGKFQNDRPGAPPPTRSIDEYLDRLEWAAAEILPAARQIAPIAATA
jgi:probable F420-dependent oxidoreductase